MFLPRHPVNCTTKRYPSNIVRKAERLATEQGLPPLHVEVNFHDYYYRFKQKGSEAVKGLFETVEKNLGKIMKMKTGNSVKIDPPTPFVGISLVYVTPGIVNGKVWLNRHRWEVMEPDFVRRDFTPELQEAITKKNRINIEYLKRCDQCWLLVVADRTKADQKFEFTTEMQKYIYESEFEKTFYLEIAQRFLTELNTKRPNKLTKQDV